MQDLTCLGIRDPPFLNTACKAVDGVFLIGKGLDNADTRNGIGQNRRHGRGSTPDATVKGRNLLTEDA